MFQVKLTVIAQGVVINEWVFAKIIYLINNICLLNFVHNYCQIRRAYNQGPVVGPNLMIKSLECSHMNCKWEEDKVLRENINLSGKSSNISMQLLPAQSHIEKSVESVHTR